MQAFHYDSVDSTNDAARRLLREGKIPATAYVLARRQTAGRGTRGRSWLSPPDAGIYLTVVDRPLSRSTTQLHLFTQAAAVACAESLQSLTGIQVKIKPINDLYVNDRKLGGILTEAIIEQNELRTLITGIGINIRKADRPVPADQVQPISLEDVMSADEFLRLDAAKLANVLVNSVLHWNAHAAHQDLDILQSAWNRYCLEPATPISIALDRR